MARKIKHDLDTIFAGMAALAEQAETLDASSTRTLLADAFRSLERVVKRAETLSGEWQRVEIPQSRGPLIEFTGRKLADHTFQPPGRTATDVTFELWETQGGAYVAVTFTEPEGGRDLAEAVVVPPGDDEQARRFAVMDHWEWTDRARTMVRKLGWSLREDVA